MSAALPTTHLDTGQTNPERANPGNLANPGSLSNRSYPGSSGCPGWRS